MLKIIAKMMLFFICINAHASRPFIIDTDVASDDVIATLYLLSHHDIDVKAITVAATGEAHCFPALQNLGGLLQLTGKNQVRIACGRELPLQGHHQFPNWLRKEADTLSGATSFLPKKKIIPTQIALTLLHSTLKNNKQPMDILAIGPLTNIAELLKTDPSIKKKIRMIYIMGGALKVRGNVHELDAALTNKVAEWNLYVDPLAADIVVRSGVPITLIPLDLTNRFPLEETFYRKVNPRSSSAVSQFFYEVLHANEKEIIGYSWYFWDVLSAVIASDESMAKMTTQKIRIVLHPEALSGATVIDNDKGHPVRVATDVETKRFQTALLQQLRVEIVPLLASKGQR